MNVHQNDTEFTARDFGFYSWDDFMRVIMQPTLLRFELRKHKSKVKHAENRLVEVERTQAMEIETGKASPYLLKQIEGWILQHALHLAYCERRLSLLSNFSRGVTRDDNKAAQAPYVHKHQAPYISMRVLEEAAAMEAAKESESPIGEDGPDGLTDEEAGMADDDEQDEDE